jgi:hypothetical protein
MTDDGLSLEQRAMRGADRTLAERKQLWLSISDITEAELDAHFSEQAARQAGVPQPGTPAPDFELDVLTRERHRSGERVRLSALRGNPVGLIFGSYT